MFLVEKKWNLHIRETIVILVTCRCKTLEDELFRLNFCHGTYVSLIEKYIYDEVTVPLINVKYVDVTVPL